MATGLASYHPDPRFPSLGEGFADVVRPAAFPSLTLRFRNGRAADSVGLGALDDEAWRAHFGRFEPLPDNLTHPLALRYHGHQFGAYNPALGDGRGFLFAQLRDGRGRLLDLGTKGSGTTPWSRGGDGRLTLKGGVREVLATEMLEALGVESSRSFSLFETGESLKRHDEPSPTRASVLVRLSHSHLRFGSFQRLAWRNEVDRLAQLLAYAVAHYAPACAQAGDTADVAVAFFAFVCEWTAQLCAQWMAAGFVHGVLNTDNMNITGESFDYGPYRFLPAYDPRFVAAYFDETGLYAYGRQPERLRWNLAQLAEALTPLAPYERLEPVLDGYQDAFVKAMHVHFLERLGVVSCGWDEDEALIDAVFRFLESRQVGFDAFFFDWYGGGASRSRAMGGAAARIYAMDAFTPVRTQLERYEPMDPTRLADPYFTRGVACTLLIDEIEAIWAPIARHDDWSRFEAKIAAIRAAGAALGRAPMDQGVAGSWTESQR